MTSIKEHLKFLSDYTKVFSKWLIIALIVGAVGGAVGSVFHILLDYVTEFRVHHVSMIYFLPLAGVAIAAIYRAFSSKGSIDTNRVIDAAARDEKVPLVMVPLIFIATLITHLFGGSAGREGAALQIGGSIGYNVGKVFKLNKNDSHIITMTGMSAVFSALFGTPVTAAVFCLEVLTVGTLNYAGLLPCIVASAAGYYIAQMFAISPVRFSKVAFPAISPGLIIRVVILAALCALVSILFCYSIKKCEHYMHALFKNCYLRALTGGAIIVLLTLAVGTIDYNGAGMDVITRAISGNARPWDFILKIVFTAITLSAGFKGGEIVPTLFVGSTFGCAVAALLGIDPGFGAAIGMIALFCGVVNCPIASIFLAIEMFGTGAMLPFGIACAVSYLLSGYSGLYKSQRILYSKLNADYIDISAK